MKHRIRFLAKSKLAVAGAALAASGTITIGDITAFVQYIKRFTQPITQMAQVFNMLQAMAAAAERIFEFLGEAEEEQDAADEEVIAAARAARADHFIRALPGGYQMELNEEATNVSQGQKQLLTIARAILADNPILILDEATSSVDTRTEHLIQEAMEELMKGRTSFVIAHRLSTIRNADVILVMKDGDIVEQGSHEDLLAQGGFYAQLYNAQFEQAG